MSQPSRKKIFTFSNIFTLILALLVLGLFVSPSFKAQVTGVLMKVGLFQPKVKSIDPSAPGKQIAGVSELAFVDAKGEEFRLSDLRGKVVFINFWATWCPPCRAEMPSINTLFQRFREEEDLVFLMVDIDRKMDRSVQYMRDNGFDLPVHAATTSIPDDLSGSVVPTTVVLNKEGAVAFRHEGIADYTNADFQKLLKGLLASSSRAGRQ